MKKIGKFTIQVVDENDIEEMQRQKQSQLKQAYIQMCKKLNVKYVMVDGLSEQQIDAVLSHI